LEDFVKKLEKGKGLLETSRCALVAEFPYGGTWLPPTLSPRAAALKPV